MEIVFAILIFGLAAGGLALGLVFGRAPVRSCGGASCAAGGACADCPRKAARETEARR